MSSLRLALGAALLAPGLLVSPHAFAADFAPVSGTLASDTSVVEIPFSVTAPVTDTFFTTSYAGGSNTDGSFTTGGGFDPVLSLFTAGGIFLADGGGGGVCGANGDAGIADAGTGLCNDARFTQALGAGSYILTVTEFPNYPLGDLASGFYLTNVDPTAISDACNSASAFQESDVSPCVQRTGNYTVDVSTTVTPEPATWLLVLPPALAAFAIRRRSDS